MKALLAVFIIVPVNLALLALAKKAAPRFKGKWQGWFYGSAELLRLALFFLTGHLLWLHTGKPLNIVFYFFAAAVLQTVLQIYIFSIKKG